MFPVAIGRTYTLNGKSFVSRAPFQEFLLFRYPKMEREALDETADYSDYETTGICPIQIKKSSYSSLICRGNQLKPSLGTNGMNCVCYKPNSIHYFTLEFSNCSYCKMIK